ncbi:MAG TPA: carotenoid oxygenase family protein [Pseudonocardia sp.]|jgi:carotenoid cleavage dioxygenase|nr:carotenoid oxygenase family protein [Pseudonocardia sp.]
MTTTERAADTDCPANPYLAGPFTPIREERSLTELAVTGVIPEHLDGRYLRNGPNPVADLDPDTYHWFMGDGMVHGVRLRGGRAEWYRNRWVRGPRAARALGERARPSGLRAGIEAIGANTSIIGHAGRTLALVEGGNACHELTEDLDTLGSWRPGETLSGGYTPHPKLDPDSGELHAVSYHFGRANTVQYSVIGPDGRARRALDIPVGGSPMMHDFALTRNHLILLDLPVTFDPRAAATAMAPRALRAPARLALNAIIGRVRVPDPIAALAGLGLRANADYPYRWNPRYPARLGVLPRHSDAADVRWFDIPPCYVFHTFNAYEDGERIVLDLVRHPKTFDTDTHGPNEGPPTLERWTVNLATGVVTQDRLDDRAQELPRINETRLGRHHRYGYSVSIRGHEAFHPVALLKHDLDTRRTTTREFGPGREPGEFVFEPNPGATAEDDGVLMGFVHDHAAGRADLELLDAATMETVATVHLPVRVPRGIHGNWLPTA